jgi:hypothetical protein
MRHISTYIEPPLGDADTITYPRTTPPPVMRLQSRWWLNAAIVPVLAAAALPKCPMCLIAYVGVLSSVGLGSSLASAWYRAWLPPLTIIFLLLAVAVLAWRARARHGYRPLLLGLTAALAILMGKFYFESLTIIYFGGISMVGASLWNSWPSKRIAAHCSRFSR